MNWYLAKMIYHIQSGSYSSTPQFDEQLRLIAADDINEALYKARKRGTNEEHTFLNDRKETVKWQFIDIAEISELNKLEDGMELYSKIEEAPDAGNYINYVRQKARAIEQKSNLQILNSWI